MSTEVSIMNEIHTIADNWKRHRNRIMNSKLNEKRKHELEKISREVEMEDHIMSVSKLCATLNTNLDTGLSPVAAKQILSTNGPNIVTTNIATGEWIRFIKNLFDWFNSFLWVGSLLCFITYITETYESSVDAHPDDLYLGCALAGAVTISGCFSYYQEAKSANIFITFRDLIPRYVTVIRAGSKLRCHVNEIVVGDLIEIQAGDRVPADIRITESHGLKCVNPLLTGNNEPFLRSNECTNTNPFLTKNLIFFSTNCVEGTAQGIVIKTGDHTLMSHLLANYYQTKSTKKSSESLLNKDITFFIRIITAVSLFIGVILSILSYTIGYSWLNAIIFMIALFVAQIPEGLFPTLSVVLSLAAKRMASKNCLVTNYETVETLGLTSTIITNKQLDLNLWKQNSL
ncbi:unnamed protein product [Oppiella nova]|uniref:Cation-transporting P-type ATPase N-terminal domain-containing protein n=1 Tax=Oppiella nova TaxID=334625 RepID=A0A7R9QHP1_9ACAR|nr:unnamed protein product [Oppiella nova]CAG2166040.1 unnamed protein product [Oppiella nova]